MLRFSLRAILILLLLSGCARPHIMLDRVLIHNATRQTITDVKLRHEPTRRIGEVSAILPNKALDIGFAKQPMLAEKGVLRWRDGEGRQREVELALPYDRAAAKEARAMILTYVIDPLGSASVSLR